jgi:hypothetical protein
MHIRDIGLFQEISYGTVVILYHLPPFQKALFFGFSRFFFSLRPSMKSYFQFHKNV